MQAGQVSQSAKVTSTVAKAQATPASVKRPMLAAPTSSREEPTLAGLREFLIGKEVFLYAPAGALLAKMTDPKAEKDGFSETGPVRILDCTTDPATGQVLTLMYRQREKGARKFESLVVLDAKGLCISLQQERQDFDDMAAEQATDKAN